MGSMTTKTCWVCGVERPIDRFRKLYDGPKGPVHRGKCYPCENYSRVNTEEKRVRMRAAKARSTDRLWQQTIEACGGACKCCGETEPAFLVVDHVNDDGAAHRREQRPHAPKTWSGKTFYAWLRQNGWPEGFQLLCANCNMAKARKGGCPHGRLDE